ncbi:unnamed protein product [Ectocarpus sp. 6 AP-2014]
MTYTCAPVGYQPLPDTNANADAVQVSMRAQADKRSRPESKHRQQMLGRQLSPTNNSARGRMSMPIHRQTDAKAQAQNATGKQQATACDC